jgi:hypothetical protein
MRLWSGRTIALLWAAWTAVLVISFPWAVQWLEERLAGVGVAIPLPGHLWGRVLLLLVAALVVLLGLLMLFLPPAALTAAWLWLRRSGPAG